MKTPSDLRAKLGTRLTDKWASSVALELQPTPPEPLEHRQPPTQPSPLSQPAASGMLTEGEGPSPTAAHMGFGVGVNVHVEDGDRDDDRADGDDAASGALGSGAVSKAAWPYRYPLSPPNGAELAARFPFYVEAIHTWRAWAGEHGVTLDEDRRKVLGTLQVLPVRAYVDTIDRAAAIVGDGWPLRLIVNRARARQLLILFPRVADLAKALKLAVDLSDPDFDSACRVAMWFADRAGLPGAGRPVPPGPAAATQDLPLPVADVVMTPRQVPIEGVHAKWLNTNQALVRLLAGVDSLDLAPPHPPRIHFTYLDPGYRASGGRWYDSHSLGDVVTVAYPPQLVLISENKDTAVGFPAVAAAVAVEGEGRGAVTLAAVPWVQTAAQVLYWGDMDIDGLEILNEFRAAGIEVTSILMDVPTYHRYRRFGTNEDRHGKPLKVRPARALLHLRDHERALYDLLTSGSAPVLRIEQERIPLDVALAHLSAVASV